MTEKIKTILLTMEQILKMLDGVDYRSKRAELLAKSFDEVNVLLLNELRNQGGGLPYGEISNRTTQKTS